MKAKIIIPVFIFFCISCRDQEVKKEEVKKCYIKQWEVFGNFDTLNVIDCNGKQGIWIPHYDNDLKDTVFFKDGKIDSLPAGWTKSNNLTKVNLAMEK